MRVAGAIVALALATRGVQAQAAHVSHTTAPVQTGPRVAELLAVAKAGAEQFKDQRAAVRAGYRRIGPDVPSMGEHWFSPRLLVASFDFGQPAMLTYVNVAGKPVLTGVVFAVVLDPGEDPPDVFGPAAHWHEHNGTVFEEAILPEHSTAPSAAEGVRLAILHGWLWSSNPRGVFAAENWSLPFLRIGIEPAPDFTEASARAVSLLRGSEDHFLAMVPAEYRGAVQPLLAELTTTAVSITRRAIASGTTLTANELVALDEAWKAMVRRVAIVAGSPAAQRIDGGR